GLIRRLSESFDISVYLPVKADGYDRQFLCGRAAVSYVRARHDDSTAAVAARMVRAFRRDHRERPFSLVHGFWSLPGGMAAVIAGLASGLPSIVSILGGEAADLPGIGYGNMARRIPRRATLWTCRHASALVALTHFQVERLRGNGLSRTGGVHVIPFGAESRFFDGHGTKPLPPPLHLLHVAHINRVKDQPTLFRALKQISAQVDCTLRIVGEDTLGGSLHRVARQMGIAHLVSFEGFVRHDRLPLHYAWAHILVHSSLYEGQGVVFAEASASGVPICGTRVGLLSDLGDAMALTAEPGDDRAIAGSVLELFRDGTRAERLRASARAWSGAHDAAWTASTYAGLYGGLL
ncbi:MAG TPA: glycosyltransferase, partial [Bacteroidota bacterium]|nr:glycosyltransferase [Bacteroidota bacterium]